METPLYTALTDYQKKKYASFHTPGHKNTISFLKYNLYDLDFTELPDTDSLFEAEGCILKAEQAAAKAFSTLLCVLSAGGCTMCIQGMLRLAAPSGGKLVCGRIIHRSAVNTMALLGIDPIWVMPEPNAGEGLAGRITPEGVRRALEKNPEAKGVYLTSPDYYGVICDIQGIACVCKEYGVPLLVDNAHGAHLGYLSENLHPIHLGASMAACSAHKTLPVLTGGAYLHISRAAPASLWESAKTAMAMFGSTSPSYLTLASLDLCNRYLADGYRDRLREMCGRLEEARKALTAAGWQVEPSDPLRLTVKAPAGMTGGQLANRLRESGVECEYADLDFLVLMLTPENRAADIERLLHAFGTNDAVYAPQPTLPLARGERVCSVREALFAPRETVPAARSLGRVCGAPTVGCPPAIPIAVSGEQIGPEALELFRRYGVEQVEVLR